VRALGAGPVGSAGPELAVTLRAAGRAPRGDAASVAGSANRLVRRRPLPSWCISDRSPALIPAYLAWRRTLMVKFGVAVVSFTDAAIGAAGSSR
jgi:hypothetical protein